jgi:hypothetical protein
MLFVSSKAGYIPEDAREMITQKDMMNSMINEYGVPENSFVPESAHCMHPKFLEA